MHLINKETLLSRQQNNLGTVEIITDSEEESTLKIDRNIQFQLSSGDTE